MIGIEQRYGCRSLDQLRELPRLTASSMPRFMTKVPAGSWTCAASPAGRTRLFQSTQRRPRAARCHLTVVPQGCARRPNSCHWLQVVGAPFTIAGKVRSLRSSVVQILIFSAISIASIRFDAKVANRALDLGVSELELHCAQVSSPAIDQHRFRAPQRVGAELGWVEPDAGDPLMNKTRVNLRKSA